MAKFRLYIFNNLETWKMQDGAGNVATLVYFFSLITNFYILVLTYNKIFSEMHANVTVPRYVWQWGTIEHHNPWMMFLLLCYAAHIVFSPFETCTGQFILWLHLGIKTAAKSLSNTFKTFMNCLFCHKGTVKEKCYVDILSRLMTCLIHYLLGRVNFINKHCYLSKVNVAQWKVHTIDTIQPQQTLLV